MNWNGGFRQTHASTHRNVDPEARLANRTPVPPATMA